MEKRYSCARPAYSTIAGILLDKETGEPVVSASVIAQGTSLGNITTRTVNSGSTCPTR